ncbi:uncharacterized protein LOC123533711 [Mercenaria mercenaria]|uniref:uncharacterized protein LOC123533711 n=1 Tax=Mercenaria mercenaria TaxID=6596 RepID=UPI00234F7056|nr:uncharacterized protein LOC123533711 [Mercenaria mercenaria]
MATAQVSQNRVYLFRLQTLIIDGGTTVVRNIFDEKSANVPLNIILHNEKTTINRLRASKTITQTQFDLLYPQSGQSPTTADFDLTLSICLLRNLKCCGLNKHFVWNAMPQAGDTSLEADICRLRMFRNEIAHISSTTTITQSTFQQKWSDIEKVLIRLNTSVQNPVQNLQQQMNTYKNSPLDEAAVKRIDREIKKWRKLEKGLESEVQLVKKDVQEVKHKVGNVKDEVHAVKKHVTAEVGNVKDEFLAVKKHVTTEVCNVKDEVNAVKKHVTTEVCNVKGVVSVVTENVYKIQEDVHAVTENVHEVNEKIADLERENRTQEPTKKAEGKAPNFVQRFFQRRELRRKMKNLKENLIALYRKRYHTLPLSPLFEENDTPLLKFYVMPDINSVKIQMAPGGKEEVMSRFTSLHDVFYKENEPCHEIYLTADAGLGKTALSKRLVLTWCQAKKCIQSEKKYFEKEDISAMSEFKFVFLLTLRDCSEEYDIDEMVIKQIIPQLANTSITIRDLEIILSKKKCLVILDGLDEWNAPACKQGKSDIPHRKVRECTILTTTRPWKLGISKIRSSEIERKLEIIGLSKTAAESLKRSVISLLRGKTDLEKHLQNFDRAIRDRGISNLETIPLLLMYLLCLWCDGIELGTCRTELYCQIVELLLKRTFEKHPDMQQSCEQSQSDIPQCFSEHEHSKTHYILLKALGQLAFETLFSETKESTLVFSQSMTEKHLTPEYLKLSLASGLLTQSTEKTFTKQISKFSFSHKTIQEFFCALYISCQNESNVKEIFLKKCKSLRSILDMSTVLVFISGMNAENISSISRNFMSVINEDKRTSEYRTTTDRNCEPLKDIQDMYISCMKEITSDKELKICCQDFFFSYDCEEEKYFNHLTQLSVDNKNNMASININTYVRSSLRKIIYCCVPFNINKIWYNAQIEHPLLAVPLNKSTKCLTVRSLYPHGSWSREMLETLQNNSLLQAIYISDFKMSHDVLNDFLNYIINRKTMTEIRLELLSCAEHDTSCSFSLDFCQHSDLRMLELVTIPEVSQLKVNSQVEHVKLSCINLGERSLPPEMGNIKHVEFRSVNVSTSTLRDLVKVVEKLSHRVTVSIDECEIKPKTEFELVKQYIRSSQNFRVWWDVRRWREFFVFETKVES